jgi:putative pyruvate formate lyase activating enzyme
LIGQTQSSYLSLLENGELERRALLAQQQMAACSMCAWDCRVDRFAGKLGVCRTGRLARVSSYGTHLGEEDVLRGWRGSGTIFFSRCNLRCQFCQNAEISQMDTGREVQPEELAGMMLELQAQNCHNINLVSPSHVVPQILAALLLAARSGLQLPLVYNTGGYDSVETLKLLDGIVDIYMPDMKYASPIIARKYSKVQRYPEVNQAAVSEMHRQVGDLVIDQRGLAVRGLLVRHLVLPNNLAGTAEIARFLVEEISAGTYINLMDQYSPAYKASQYPKLNRRVTPKEYLSAIHMARTAGLHRLDRM